MPAANPSNESASVRCLDPVGFDHLADRDRTPEMRGQDPYSAPHLVIDQAVAFVAGHRTAA